MPTFYNYTEGGQVYSFDDVFVPADAFRQGNLWGWGTNTNGQLGINNTTSPKCTPVTTFAGGTNWKQVSCGQFHTAAIKTDGTLWMWGNDNSGQLGINASSRSTPVTTFAGGTNWKQVSCGSGAFAAAIKTDGTLWTWGSNSYGQLGDNTVTTRFTPVTTFAGGTNWKQVSCGSDHMAAIKTDGTLWTWGTNGNAQLGNNASSRSTPVTTFAGGTNWKQVSCALFHTAAIKTDGTLWTWGSNSYGQLGDNTTGFHRSTPVTTFAGGTNWKQVSCEGDRSCAAIKTDGTLWVWGQSTNGKLGTNTGFSFIQTPVTTFAGGTNWKQVASGGNSHMAAIKTDGTLWNWGVSAGRLGDNAPPPTRRFTPVTTFAGGTNWKQVSDGSVHAAAITYIDDYQ